MGSDLTINSYILLLPSHLRVLLVRHRGVKSVTSLHKMADNHGTLFKAAIYHYLLENMPKGQKTLGMGLFFKTIIKSDFAEMLDAKRIDFYCIMGMWEHEIRLLF